MAFRKYIDYDSEMEEKVLGVLIMEPDQYAFVYNILREESFYEKKNLEIYKAIRQVYENGGRIDYLMVQRVFFDKGITTIDGQNIPYIMATMMSGICSSANLEIWCIKLRELSAKRLMIQLRNSGQSNGDIFEEAHEIGLRLNEILTVKSTDDWVHISAVMVKIEKHMAEMKENKGRLPGISSTIHEMDLINGGFRGGQMIVLGARPGVGKSAYMGRIAVRAAHSGSHVGIISLEMNDTDIGKRMVSSESDVEFWKIDRYAFSEKEEQEELSQLKTVYKTLSTMTHLPIHFSDKAQVNIHDIRAKAERLKSRGKLDILIIDYLQLVESESTSKNTNREQEIAKMSRGIKTMAMDLNIPIIVLAQLNRASEAKNDKKPELHNLRESGAIEQDADVVLFLHRDFKSGIKTDETGNSTEFHADLLCRKWRNGREIDTKLGFDGNTMKFYDLVDMYQHQIAAPAVPTIPINNSSKWTEEQAPF